MKRKADISIDEWLAKGVGISELNPVTGVESQGASTTEPRLTVTDFPLGGKAEPVTATTVGIPGASTDVAETLTDVAGTSVPVTEGTEAAAEWFWRLLEQAGYERV